MTDSHAFPHSAADLSDRLYEAWTSGSLEQTRALTIEIPVPGPVALRARFHFLTDLRSPIDDAEGAIDRGAWRAQIELETDGDAALIANDTNRAKTAFGELVAGGNSLAMRLSRVHGLIGLGDTARQIDERDEALSYYENALALTREIGHRFGEVRTLVPLAYLTLASSTASEARDLFCRAEAIATDLDERLYLANALIGKGESLQRLRETGEARTTLERALVLSRELKSSVAEGNAAQRLADLELRTGRNERAGELLGLASSAYEHAGVLIGASTAADSLADLHLANAKVELAAAQYRRAFNLSAQAGYRRGEAHALTGLAHCAESQTAFSDAKKLHRRALAIYEALDDLVGRTSANAGLARSLAKLGRGDAAVERWLSVIEAIEEMRMTPDRLDLQEEYQLRFSESYRGAFEYAVAAGSSEAFIAVFESLAGRRLAGLIEGAAHATGDAELLAQLLARADRMAWRNPSGAKPTREERVRRLGAVIMRFGLGSKVEESFDAAAASAYRPFVRNQGSALLAAIPIDAEALLLAPIPAAPERIAWLWRSENGVTMGVTELPADAEALLGELAQPWGRRLKLADLAPLCSLVPEPLKAKLRANQSPLLLVPLGQLWSVPWPAVPIDEGGLVLGEVSPLVLTPSLSVHAKLASDQRRQRPAMRPVVTWRSHEINRHPLDPVFIDDPAWEQHRPAASSDLKSSLFDADADALFVLACHGYPIAGLGHYLELADNDPLTPTDMLGATQLPEELVLVCCWGARTTEARSAESLTVATLALTRGAKRVAATLSELGDTPSATRFVEAFLHRLRDRPMPVALRDATQRLFESEGRDVALTDWSPLVIIGCL